MPGRRLVAARGTPAEGARETPLLLTEHVRGLEAKAPWITADTTDFLRRPGLRHGHHRHHEGGDLAEAFGLDCEIHAAGPSQRHCMAAIRNSDWYELSLVGPGVDNQIPPVFGSGYSDALKAVGSDGRFPVPNGDGLGVELGWDYIAANRTALHSFTADGA